MDTAENKLTRVPFAKTNLNVKLFYPSLKEYLVGIYDDPENDPREHVISVAFFKIEDGEMTSRNKVNAVKSFYETKTKIRKSPLTILKMFRTLFLILEEFKCYAMKITL